MKAFSAPPRNPEIDPVLIPYEQTTGQDEEAEALSHLVWNVANPIIQNEISYKFRNLGPKNKLGLATHQAEDVIADARLSVTRRLQQFKSSPELSPIGNFRAYVRSVAENTFFALIRKETTNNSDKRVALNFEHDGLKENCFHSTGNASRPIDIKVEQREFLRVLWDQIRAIGSTPAKIYLLGMREEKGTGDIRMFTESGMVSRCEIARALEMSESWLEARWRDLPLPDREIAFMVGLTAQQVSNKRDKIVALLARRLKAFDR